MHIVQDPEDPEVQYDCAIQPSRKVQALYENAGVDQLVGVTGFRSQAVWVRIPPPAPPEKEARA